MFKALLAGVVLSGPGLALAADLPSELIEFKRVLVLRIDSYQEDGNAKEVFETKAEGHWKKTYRMKYAGKQLLLSKGLDDSGWSIKSEAVDFDLATQFGDCDESTEIFSVIRPDPKNKNGAIIDRYNWVLHAKGECSGNSATTCGLSHYARDVVDFKKSVSKKIEVKFKTLEGGDESECSGLVAKFIAGLKR